MAYIRYSVCFYWKRDSRELTRRRTLVRFSYIIQDNVVYMTIADKSYPRKLAFSYLDELSKEFAITYGDKVENVRKPYAFVGFGEWTNAVHTRDCADASEVFLLTCTKTRSCPRRRGCTKTLERPMQPVHSWTD